MLFYPNSNKEGHHVEAFVAEIQNCLSRSRYARRPRSGYGLSDAVSCDTRLFPAKGVKQDRNRSGGTHLPHKLSSRTSIIWGSLMVDGMSMQKCRDELNMQLWPKRDRKTVKTVACLMGSP